MTWFRKHNPSAADRVTGVEATRTVDRVVGAGSRDFALARDRVALLRLVSDSRICVPERVMLRAGGEVVAIMPRIHGIDLDALLAARGHLSVGECVYLAEHLCGAAAALHDNGIAHGDISPANVMISSARITLVDTVAGALPHERGTADYRAPERASGASAFSDVYSIGAVLARCIDPDMRQGFMGWLDPLLDADPESRPTARGVEKGIGRCARPAAIPAPNLGLVGELRAQAHEPRQRTTVLRSSWPWRLRRVMRRIAVAGAVTVVLAGVGAYVLPLAISALEADAVAEQAGPLKEAKDGGDTADGAGDEDVADAARELTNGRFAALAAADGEALLATGAPGSEVWAQLEAQASKLESGDLQFDGVEATVVEVTVVDGDAPDTRGSTVAPLVSVTYVVSAHSVRHRDPTSDASEWTHVGAHSETAVLELSRDGATWRVARVLPQS